MPSMLVVEVEAKDGSKTFVNESLDIVKMLQDREGFQGAVQGWQRARAHKTFK